MENKVTRKDIEAMAKEVFLIEQLARNYYLSNYGIKSKTVDLVVSYSGSSCLDDTNFHFNIDDSTLQCPRLEFGNSKGIPNDQIIAWKRHVKVYFENCKSYKDLQDKNTLKLIFNDGSVVNIKSKQDILNFKWATTSVNDFIIFV